MSFLLYRISIQLFKFGHWILSTSNVDKKYIHNLRISPPKDLVQWRNNDSKNRLVIIHCASLGEFEMSLPIYNSLKEKINCDFIFTFFSASGYDNANIPLGSKKTYLPFDNRKDVQTFINRLKPDLFIFIKYEYWFTLLSALQKSSIPYGFINVLDQKLPPIFKFKFAREIVSKSAFYCVTNKKTKEIYNSTLELEAQLFQDLRYIKGSINSKVKNSSKYPFIQKDNFKNIIVCGSIYPNDFEIIKNSIKPNSDELWILAPHKIETKLNEDIISNFPNSASLSSLLNKQSTTLESNIILVDTIGDLKFIYSFGSIAYVGGGFDKGIHNVIEPVSFDIPVIIGPKFDAFPEVLKLISEGKVHAIENQETFEDALMQIPKSNSDEIENTKLNELDLKINLEKLTSYIVRNEI